ncbi:hypothetical protein JS530_03300 [Bifidobacterium sp. LC6]|uniref:Uncharacterized protein n=1 Tax=Bifidobacterium colobi TaxID=2809026 RepID=A0ABS5UV82_9BIFI|nr:hypothetical protein [Bifidobacterium colobi]MBT1174544.1 hypothetical protein [Bifidobacterium colobi]
MIEKEFMVQGQWMFPIKAAGTGMPTVFQTSPMSDGPASTVRWVDMAVASSGNVQLILDIFNKTGAPAYVSRLCSGPILSLRNHVAVDAVQFVSPVASVATRDRWSQALNESLPASEPPAVMPGVWERRILQFPDRLNPNVARTVRVLSMPKPGETPYVYTSEDGTVNQLQVRFAAANAPMWTVNIYPRMRVFQVLSGPMRGLPQRFV